MQAQSSPHLESPDALKESICSTYWDIKIYSDFKIYRIEDICSNFKRVQDIGAVARSGCNLTDNVE